MLTKTLMLAASIACAGTALAAPPAATAAGPLETAIIDHGELDGPDVDLALTRVRAAGARYFRLMLPWYTVAPAERPTNFNAEDPNDPAYRWSEFDRKLTLLARHGLRPIVVFHYPPAWAGGGFTPSPDPAELAKFARAAATRYRGVGGLPTVRHWMVWNEPNVTWDFSPQFDEADRPVSPARYRELVNRMAEALHAVDPNNIVIAGALSPFATHSRDYLRTMAPLQFMRQFLCMSAGRPPRPTCTDRAQFDLWAHHPYTRGGPTHRARARDDVSLGNLREMTSLIAAAVRARHVVSRRKIGFWATEFSWDTNPPDPRAVPVRLQARWVSEAMHRMWGLGTSLVGWLQLRDAPYPERGVQAGLWFRGGERLTCDRPKPTLASFRFPFVAYRRDGRIDVWGRTPPGTVRKVVVERATGRRWRPIARVRADRHGIFGARLRSRAGRGRFREVLPAPPRYSEAVFCRGAASYWRLGERAGTGAADELGVRTGAYAGGVSLGASGALRRDSNTAVSLDGVDDVVSLGTLLSPKTVELWVNARGPLPTTAAAFSNRNEQSHGIFVGISGDGRARVYDSFPLVSPQRVDDGAWHHLVYTYDGSTGRLFVDGKLAASGTYQRVERFGEARIGYDPAPAAHLRALVDEVAVYEFPLTAAEVRSHFRARTPGRPQTRTVRGSYVRARAGSFSSQPFSLVRARDRCYDPFGVSYPGVCG
ncbi:MAG: hypothetical protein M3322_04965 [Actinomycetota bacterium]|nr:hypothetical protein [Actinomycetota bacterium]